MARKTEANKPSARKPNQLVRMALSEVNQRHLTWFDRLTEQQQESVREAAELQIGNTAISLSALHRSVTQAFGVTIKYYAFREVIRRLQRDAR